MAGFVVSAPVAVPGSVIGFVLYAGPNGPQHLLWRHVTVAESRQGMCLGLQSFGLPPGTERFSLPVNLVWLSPSLFFGPDPCRHPHVVAE